MDSLVREKKLYDASYIGDIQSLNKLLREDELAINHYGRSFGFCFNETPLHIAASRGHVDFAKALLQHKPDLVNELDSRLRSPLHLASANGRIEMVKLLLDADSDVCLFEDESGRTPLHLAAMVKGRVEVVNELVRARPEAIMYPLNRTKTVTILHSYVIRNGPKALEQLVEVDPTFLNSQDGEGNTMLHKVVALKQVETLKYLVSRTQLLINLKNGNSFTALDIIEQIPRDSETTKFRELLVNAEALNSEILPTSTRNTTQLAHGEVDQITVIKPPSRGNDTKDNKESWLEKKRDALLIAATVIAGMAYQAGLSPPGGVWDHNADNYATVEGKHVNVTAGTSIMAANFPLEYILFWAFNTASFIAALSIVILLIRGSPRMGTTWFRILKQKLFMWFLSGVVWVTTTTMTLTYLVAMATTTPGNKGFTVEITTPWHKGFGDPWDGTVKIVICSVLAWLGLVSIIFLVNVCRFVIYIIVKVAKCIKYWSFSQKVVIRNANERERQGRP